MLIVEGPDMIGKTTLCEALIKRLNALGYPLIPQHFGLLPKGWNYYADYLPFMNARTVMDRFILSEVVYGNVLRGSTQLDPETYRMLDAQLRLQGSVTVVIYATDEWLSKQIVDKYAQRDEKFSPAQIMQVNRGFANLVNSEVTEHNPWVQGYACDVDFTYEVNATNNFPSSDMNLRDSIVNLYMRRTELFKRCNREY